MGTVATLFWTWVTATAPISYSVFPSEDGWAKPLPELIEAASEEDSTLVIKLKPDQVADTYVCEFSEMSAINYRRLFLSYVDRYRMCFDIRQTDENEYLLLPNRISGQMKLVGNSWQCLCTGE